MITVTTSFDGAAPETIDREVTGVIEGAMGRIPGVVDISSRSSAGRSRVTVEFSGKTDLNVAASDARDSIGRVLGQLPDDADEPRIVKADANSDPVMRLGVTSRTMTVEALTDLVENTIEDRLIAVPGVADVAIYGGRDRIFRVDVDQLALASRGLTVADVREALATVAFDSPAGSLDATNQSLVVRTTATVNTPEAFGALMLADRLTRLSDVATVTLGPKSGTSILRSNGEGGLGIGIIRQAQSNTLEISQGVSAVVAELQPTLPAGVSLFVTGDDAAFIHGALDEVVRSLALAVVIVVAVIWLFLRDWRATLIPALTIPVALIGTLAAIYVVGYSVNILTLLALVARHRPRRRRRNRRAREHRPPARPGARAAGGGGARNRAGVLRGDRDDDDARRGLPAAVLPARPERPAVPRVRRHPRALGGDLGLRRAVALPDDGLAHAARPRDPRPRGRRGLGRPRAHLSPAAPRGARARLGSSSRSPSSSASPPG